MLLDLDFEIKVGNNKTNEIEKFTKELNDVLQKDKILVYQGYDSRKFTNENKEKIWDKREKLIEENINEKNINGADENKLYEIRNDVAGGIGVLEYNKTYDNRTYLTVKKTELPENVEEGMFFRKVDDSYILDKETTEKIYNENKIKNIFKNIIEKIVETVHTAVKKDILKHCYLKKNLK